MPLPLMILRFGPPGQPTCIREGLAILSIEAPQSCFHFKLLARIQNGPPVSECPLHLGVVRCSTSVQFAATDLV
jgi:hypothetical protein